MTPKRLTVRDRERNVVAEVVVDPMTDLDRSPHVVGTFTAGPGFDRVGAMLAHFNQIYSSGNLEAASAAHAELDRLGLIATRDDEFEYSVSVVYFQQGGLLFSASPRER